ncbi:hypothetical protein ISS21_01790 [Patescibacteria group bacterium]|nr:hypothetical protein [Patescibacteria group bacterium]
MKGKGTKLIIGIILLIIGIVLYLLKAVNPWVCLVIIVIGLILVILSFTGKGKKLPAVSPQPGAPAEAKEPVPETPTEPVEVGKDQGSTPSV